MNNIVKVKYEGEKHYLNVSRVIAMCEKSHSIYFEYVIWYLKKEDWDKVFEVFMAINQK